MTVGPTQSDVEKFGARDHCCPARKKATAHRRCDDIPGALMDHMTAAMNIQAAAGYNKAAAMYNKVAQMDRRAAAIYNNVAAMDHKAAAMYTKAAEMDRRAPAMYIKVAAMDHKAAAMYIKVAAMDHEAAAMYIKTAVVFINRAVLNISVAGMDHIAVAMNSTTVGLGVLTRAPLTDCKPCMPFLRPLRQTRSRPRSSLSDRANPGRAGSGSKIRPPRASPPSTRPRLALPAWACRRSNPARSRN